MEQETIMRIQMMEQETNHLNEQLKSIDEAGEEMKDLSASLEEIENNETSEIMANLGKRIFIPVEIRDRNLIVEVGKGNFVKKSISETRRIVEDEKEKLSEARNQVLNRLNELQEEMNQMILEFQKEQMKGHVHGPDCDHDEEVEE